MGKSAQKNLCLSAAIRRAVDRFLAETTTADGDQSLTFTDAVEAGLILFLDASPEQKLRAVGRARTYGLERVLGSDGSAQARTELPVVSIPTVFGPTPDLVPGTWTVGRDQSGVTVQPGKSALDRSKRRRSRRTA